MQLDLSMFSFIYTSEELSAIANNVVTFSLIVSSVKVQFTCSFTKFLSLNNLIQITGWDDNEIKLAIHDTYTGLTIGEGKIFQQLKTIRKSQGEPVSELIVKSKPFLVAARAYGGTPV